MAGTKTLTAPPPGAVLDLVDQFYPGAPAFRPDASPPAFAELEACYACLLLDDEGETVGAVVSDLRGTLILAGKLLMLPEGGLQDQANEGSVSEQLVDAMSEVFNHMTIAINQVEGNPHVRSTYAETRESLVAKPEGAWLASATENILHLSADTLSGAGRMWFVPMQ